MDEKVSKQSFAAYCAWHKYIKNAEPKLTKGLVKSTLFAYCAAMAVDGTNGLGCYTSDATIARQLGLYDARAVRPYRHEALRLGWFVWTGEMHGRAQVLDIAIPDGAAITDILTVKPAEGAEHDRSVEPARCPACVPFRQRLADREMTMDQILEAHRGY